MMPSSMYPTLQFFSKLDPVHTLNSVYDSAQYVLSYNLANIMVDRIWVMPVMVDGKQKYLKMFVLQQALQWNIVTSSVYRVMYWWLLLQSNLYKTVTLGTTQKSSSCAGVRLIKHLYKTTTNHKVLADF